MRAATRRAFLGATPLLATLASSPILAAPRAPRKPGALESGGAVTSVGRDAARAASDATVTPVSGLPDLASVLLPMDPPALPPEGVFMDAEGGEHRLDEFRGNGMVINFWATWCQPCIAEMPSLVTLSRAMAPYGIAVLTLSSDRGGAAVVRAWYESRGITGLPVLLDPRGTMARAWGARGIPATYVVARDGTRRGYIEGAADWSSAATAALIRRLVEG